MISKLIFWLGMNRKKVGYSLGGINVLCGLNALAFGQTSNGFILLFVGFVLAFDAWSMP
jgi:hypothetical protein